MKSQWKSLINEMLERIKKIDDATPWRETEPDWWIEMREAERLLISFKENPASTELANRTASE